MDSLEYNINVMLDLLSRKKSILAQIYNITDNQANLLLSGQDSPEMNVFFNAMSDEKQKIIDEVVSLDDTFQAKFDECKDAFEAQAQFYKPLVELLQQQIREIMDLDANIRWLEESNRMLADRKKPHTKIKALKVSKSHLLSEYARNNNYGKD